MMLNPSAVAFWRTAVNRVGVTVRVQRASGYAPNVVLFTAEVAAIVKKIAPDTTATSRDGVGASDMGAIPQHDRTVLVVGSDLADARFPLPVQIGDLVVLPDTGEQFKVTEVDPYLRANAGVIELTVTGVS